MHPKIEEAYKIGMLQVPEEMEFMCEFVEWKKPKVILEIGACYGASMMLWCHFAKPKLAISLDIRTASCGRADVNYTKRSEMFAKLKVKEVVGSSHDAEPYDQVVKLLGKRKIDMLVIDGDHTFDGVFQDYLIYKPLVSPTGMIMFHDALRSKYHDDLDCKASYVWEQLKAKLKITVTGNGNGGGSWGIMFP